MFLITSIQNEEEKSKESISIQFYQRRAKQLHGRNFLQLFRALNFSLNWLSFSNPIFRFTRLCVVSRQGDQIGRLFAIWAIFFF
jgi:hypothetical protein